MFDALTQEDYDWGQSMTLAAPAGLPAANVVSYPDNIPAGNAPTYSNGFSVNDFVGGLKSVANSALDVAKTAYGIEAAANAAGLQRLQTASAIDIARTQSATARDVSIANAQTEAVKAQIALNAAKQTQQLQTQLAGGSSSSLVLLVLLGVGAWLAMRGAA